MKKKREKPHVFLVDDDRIVRDAVYSTLEQMNIAITAFPSAEDCLRRLHDFVCDVLITDVKMKGTDGIQLLRKAKQLAPAMPVILITGYGDVPTAVRAIKLGASDFIEKPIRRDHLIGAIDSALRQHDTPHIPMRELLTKAEADVLHLIVQGKSNKEIAEILDRSPRTIEDHRRNIMRKLDAKNLVDLIKRAATVHIYEPPEQ